MVSSTNDADRGQAHTLEAFMAALLLIGSIVFALQITAVTPLTASTSSQHIENQQLQVARGLLDSAQENGSLRTAILNWNESAGSFRDANEQGYFTNGGPTNTTFGAMLNRTFIERGIALNVNIVYATGSGVLRSRQMVNLGTPSDHAVTATRTLTLFDNDRLHGNSTTLGASTSYFAPDLAPGENFYNMIRVEVVVWRM